MTGFISTSVYYNMEAPEKKKPGTLPRKFKSEASLGIHLKDQIPEKDRSLDVIQIPDNEKFNDTAKTLKELFAENGRMLPNGKAFCGAKDVPPNLTIKDYKKNT